ncbi:type II toxin-antitoxin system RelE/ParE family toxin [uncultured Amphritea sp.]|uniref:type II toxin-antitoxin system RelE/ParE family toxin n=1 Tax=uncultured Amphritea sp. TaxID=981605 RepID=UPI00344FCE0B
MFWKSKPLILDGPQADTIKGTKKVKNLKELVIQHAGKPYRVFYAFDPKRRAVLLCGGRKDGSKDKQCLQTDGPAS